VLHTFTNGSDGKNPNAGVAIGSGGVLYGTANGVGASGDGTVFMLTPPGTPGGAWSMTVLHTFTGPDGASPGAGVVIGSGGVLFGTTTSGGGSAFAGTVFMLTPPGTPGGTWTETVLHKFTNGADGAQPGASLAIDSTGLLYGTAYNGGTGSAGTVFSLTP
jgi:hypothetical protein